jgi:hypothetical protein
MCRCVNDSSDFIRYYKFKVLYMIVKLLESTYLSSKLITYENTIFDFDDSYDIAWFLVFLLVILFLLLLLLIVCILLLLLLVKGRWVHLHLLLLHLVILVIVRIIVDELLLSLLRVLGCSPLLLLL